jgi:thiamine biosynthesis lipoprotein
MHCSLWRRSGPTCLLAVVTVVGAVVAQTGDLPKDHARVERVVVAMGTTLRIDVAARSRGTGLAATEAAVRAVELVEQRLSTWREDSELSRLNRAPIDVPFVLSVELRRDLEAAAGWWRATEGAFDPTVGTLLAAHDLHGAGRWPDAAGLAAARHDAGFSHVVLAADCVLRRRAVQFDPGAFGKGLALDAAAAAARAAGASAATFDFGGQVLVGDDGTDARTAVAIADPRHRQRAVLRLEIGSGSVASSGNSERGLQSTDGVSATCSTRAPGGRPRTSVRSRCGAPPPAPPMPSRPRCS